jgi:hypothetical protein
MMVHVAVHWPRNDSDNIHLWPFAVQHAFWLFNQIPNRITGLSPLEVFTKTKSDHCDLQRAFGDALSSFFTLVYRMARRSLNGTVVPGLPSLLDFLPSIQL